MNVSLDNIKVNYQNSLLLNYMEQLRDQLNSKATTIAQDSATKEIELE